MLRSFIILLVSLSPFGNAEPLGRVPRIDLLSGRFILDMQSDLWTSPYQQKNDPVRRYLTGLKIPLLRSKEWNATINVDAEGLRIARPDLVIGEDKVEVLTDLRNQSVGAGFDKRNEAGGWYSLVASYESASDEPFKNKRDRYFTGTGLYAFDPLGSWQPVVGVSQSNNRGYRDGRVLPVAGLFYRPNRNFMIGGGFPFLIAEWNEANRFVINLSVTLVSLDLIFRRDLTEDFFYQLKGGVAERAFLHTGRIREDKRIYFEEKFVEGGIGLRLDQRTTTLVSIGRSFDRRVYEAYEVFKDFGPSRSIDSDFYGSIRLEFAL